LTKTALVTGCAGFIGFHVCQRLLDLGYEVAGLDNLNPFYNEGLKQARLDLLAKRENFLFIYGDISNQQCIQDVFRKHVFDSVIHLAAQAGVRYSLENPHVYLQSNIVGFVNLLEAARKKRLTHFVFASSSSVYGANDKTPFSESDNVDHPISLYAATKKSDELIAHVYAHLYELPITGLRFFTVYGPWGRPDMALFKFCKAIFEGTPIGLFNPGRMKRDFTYIDDVVEGVVRMLKKPPVGPRGSQSGPSPLFRLYNIGNGEPVELMRLLQVLEQRIGKKAIVNSLPMQPGDMPQTYADIDRLSAVTGYRPRVAIEEGVNRFVDWYREYYRIVDQKSGDRG
jgi:UDP-glucuronate 4-epimerase